MSFRIRRGFVSVFATLLVFFAVSARVVSAGVVSTDSLVRQPANERKRFIVTLEKSASPDDFCARRGFKPRKQARHSPNGLGANLATNEALILPKMNMVICHFNEDEARTARGEKGVRWVEADGIVAPCGQVIPSGVMRIGADHFPVAHINGTPKPLNVDVAVLDSGIDPHEDLNIYANVCAFNNDTSDEVGHGTGVAGIIAAIDNDFGVVGVAPGVRLWNVKAFGNPPNDAWSNILEGMEYIYENADQISVVNMSFVNPGTNGPYNATRISVQQLVDSGVVVVAAAGNAENNPSGVAQDIAGPDGVFGTGDDSFPAAFPESMAISAMDPTNDTIASFSNFSQIIRTNTPGNNFGAPAITNYAFSPGGAIDVAAPGVNIFSTVPFILAGGSNGYYGYFTGTSGAAPHVTGLVALYIAANGRATNAQGVYAIRQAIINASLPQAQWHPHGQPFDAVNNPTGDPDTNPEPLAIASENWVPLPLISNAAGAPGNFQVGFAAIPGYDYTLQSTVNLAPPIAWANVATVSGTNSVAPVSLTDTNTAAQSFYHVKRSPTP